MGRKKKITNGVKVSFYVPREWNETMKSIAENNAMTIADTYRHAVREYIERHKERSWHL
jgi:predicted DNA-binding protein